VRLSLLGVFNINNLTECTKVLPQITAPSFNPPDEPVLNTWTNITEQIQPFAKAVMDGADLSGLAGLLNGQSGASGQQGTQAVGNQGGRKPCKRRLPKRD
jgi:hypothetical protein